MVSNLCYDRRSRIAPDVQAAQSSREADLLKMQAVVEAAAAKLKSTDPALMREFMTNYSASTADAVFRNWQRVADCIPVKNVDGYVKNAQGRSRGVGRTPGMAQASRSRPARTLQGRNEVNPDRRLRDVRILASFPRADALRRPCELRRAALWPVRRAQAGG